MSFIAAAVSVASMLVGGASAFVIPSQVGRARAHALVRSHEATKAFVVYPRAGMARVLVERRER